MKNKIKDQKGVSLVALSITVIILLVITNLLIYNVKDNLGIEKLKDLQNDIENLSDKVSSYYAQYGKIPANTTIEYMNINNLKEAGIISEAVDTGNFHVIDLAAIENLTLTYGKDFEKIKSNSTADFINSLRDIYIINEASHHIFYVKGISIDGEMFYTNYTKEDVDKKAVDLRYIDNVKIPDGYTYVSGNKKNGITIQKTDDITKKYVWIVIEKRLEEIPNTITVDNETEFLESANSYNGYYKSATDNGVIYLPIEEQWSAVYDKEGRYIDKNGDSVTIPQGFQVCKTAGRNQINQGLVIKNIETGDSYVWIEVPKSIYKTANSNEDYDNIEKDMKSYTKEYGGEECLDTWYDGCGLTNQQYTELKKKMLQSVYNNNGFWISQYEIGSDSYVPALPANDVRKPVSKKNAYPFNYVTVSKAQELATNMASGNKTSSLMFGIQWELVCKFIEETEEKNIDEIKVDSSNWGNYTNVAFDITQGNYSEDNGKNYKEVNGKYTKPESTVGLGVGVLLTTGATPRNQALNIYDLAGNVLELTLEKSIRDTYFTIIRGGEYYSNGTLSHCNVKLDQLPSVTDTIIGFRTTLY